MGGEPRWMVLDANVVINFAHVEGLEILGGLPAYRCAVPEEVVLEVTDPGQTARLDAAIGAGMFDLVRITDLGEMDDYAGLRRMLGAGEAACLAIAHSRGWLVASDERRALRRLVRERIGEDRLRTTPDLIVDAIRCGSITVEEADRWKAVLETRRFRMPFASFADLLDGGALS